MLQIFASRSNFSPLHLRILNRIFWLASSFNIAGGLLGLNLSTSRTVLDTFQVLPFFFFFFFFRLFFLRASNPNLYRVIYTFVVISIFFLVNTNKPWRTLVGRFVSKAITSLDPSFFFSFQLQFLFTRKFLFRRNEIYYIRMSCVTEAFWSG